MRTRPGSVRAAFVATFVGLAFVAAGCSSSTTTTTPGTSPGSTPSGTAAGSTPSGSTAAKVTGSITVSAAASLTDPFKKIGDQFQQANPGATVTFNFGSSGTLSKQIIDGSAADLFASADEANMKKLTDASLIAGSPQVFAKNKLAIVVKKGNPKAIKSLQELPTAGTISLCGTDVPCGKYADQILQQAGVTIPTDKITRGQDVKATLAAVSDGDAEAGIVYATDITGDKVEAVVIPDAQNAIAVYPIGVLKASTQPDTANAFMAYVVGPNGQAVLKAAGFLPPS